MTLKLGLLHRVLEYYQVCSNDDPGLTLKARSNLVPYAFVWEKGKTMDFLETIVMYDLKLATDDWSDKKFLFCPLGAVYPLPRGYIHVLNHEKKCIKSDFKEIFFFNLQQMTKVTRCFCWHQNFVVVSPCPGAIYMYKIMKPEAHGPQRSPECTAMKAIFSQNIVNVACKKI